ncbi:MAG TPA: sigma-70 family RNA polymerase sigma factor [Baekduia sp.]
MDDRRPAHARLTEEQAQELVLSTVAKHAESLLRVAYRHSLCPDDAHDAYQRGMEILLRRAPTLDPRTAHKWLHVVVKHEAMEVRQARMSVVGGDDVDYDRHEARHLDSPEERALTIDRATRAAEALQRLKPHELRTVWLKAIGHSYREISDITGFSATKVNRCLAEGRKSFLERFEGIETGAECERWQAVISAIVDGEATAAQMADARPHLRNCPGCRATLRSLQDGSEPMRAVLPVGLAGVGAKLSGLVERLMPGGGADMVSGAGGAGVLGAGGMKVAGLLAAGAAAVGGGTVVVDRGDAARAEEKPKAVATARTASAPPRGVLAAATTAKTAPAVHRTHRARAARVRVTARRPAPVRRAAAPHELKPVGAEVAIPVTATAASASTSSKPSPAPASAAPADSSGGEFAPQP